MGRSEAPLARDCAELERQRPDRPNNIWMVRTSLSARLQQMNRESVAQQVRGDRLRDRTKIGGGLAEQAIPVACSPMG